MDDDDLAAVVRTTARRLSEWLSLGIGLAALGNTELLREALASVFDLTNLERMSGEALRMATEARAAAIQARDEARRALTDLEALQTRIDALCYTLERLESAP